MPEYINIFHIYTIFFTQNREYEEFLIKFVCTTKFSYLMSQIRDVKIIQS